MINRKKIVSLLFFLAVTQLVVAQQISVDNSLSAQALVENTLQTDCVIIQNISSPVNGSSIGIGSFGSFNRGASNFPFESGMVLTTGNANSGGNGENTDLLNEGSSAWISDSDLETALGISNTLNATAIEFEFTSVSNTLQFNYILASEEYFLDFPCDTSDGFAFLIREAGTSNSYQNIALVPGTTTPVNTTTIRPNIEGFCGPLNSEYFQGFNVGDTNYNGRTTVLSAIANITPNIPYQIKLVIADQTDRNYDSAVFIEANSFVPTVDLGEDFSTCASTVELNGDINNPNAQYQWFVEGAMISGATQPLLEVSDTGLYLLEIDIPLGDGFCTIEDEVSVEISSTQSTTPMTNYTLCDDLSNDGVEVFDLDSKTDEAINSVSAGNYNVTYHTSLPNAQSGDNPLNSNYANQVSPQLIFVRIIDPITGCLAINQFQLIVSERPTATEPPVMEVCDDEVADGFTTINLNENNDAILDGQSGLVVTYHYTQAEADSYSNPIPMPYVNDSQTDVVYASVIDPTSGCSSTTSVTISVLDPPAILNDQQYFIDSCDQEYDGFAEFDLTTVEAEILDGLTNVTVTYHLTQEDALTGDNPIPNPTNFENTVPTEQIVYIRVVNSNGCASISPIEIHPNLLLSGTSFTDSSICDIGNDNIEAFDLDVVEAVILQDIRDASVFFYETEEDRDNDTNALDHNVDYFPPTIPYVLYVTVINPICEEQGQITLDLDPIAEFPDLDQQSVCDVDQDGITVIDLSFYDDLITQGQSGFNVTYFASFEDADSNMNQFPTFYENSTNPFTLFARVTSQATACASVSTFEIVVNPAPETETPELIFICDDDQDGFSIFNLEDVIPDITANTTNLEFSFYNLLVNAENEAFPISNPENYNTQSETVFVRAENTSTGCFSIEEIEITVNTLPIIPIIEDFNFCENDTDEVGEFLLVSKDEEILNGQTDKEVLYFRTVQDAETGNNPIDKNTFFQNTENPQTIHVRVENITDNDCNATSSFLLVVGTNPDFNEPIDMFICDDGNNDTFVTINLDDKTAEITEGISEDLTITYYSNPEDFANQTNPITTSTYTNTTNPQEVFVTIANGTICVSDTTFIINVIPIPTVEEIDPFEDCDIDYDESIFWDLTEAEINILDVRQDNIVVTYFLSEENADNDTDPIIDPENFENTSNPQTVFVKVVNTDFNCPVILPIELNVFSPPAFNDFGTVETCDNDTNTYDINQVNSVLVNDSSNINITYYTNEQDAIATENEIIGDYNYQTDSDILYARLEDATTECFFIYPFTLMVNEPPIANMPDNLEDCDDDDDQRLFFDLSLQNSTIIGAQNDAFLEVTYHDSEANAVNNTSPLDNDYNTTNGEIIYARVTNTETQCFSITQFSVIINPLPIVDIPDQAICPENFPLVINADTGFANDMYEWSTGEMTTEIEITEIGSYSVTITTPNGCTVTSEFNVIESEPAVIEVVETVDFSDPNNITIEVSGIGDYLFQLDDGPLQESGLFENVTLGYHILTIIDQNGCASVTREVLVIDAPKFITPNNDGAFDTWHIIGVETLPGTVVSIFDRYGKLIKQLSHTSQGWDGTYNGNRMPASDYWWSADVKGGDIEFTATGHFTLKR